MSTDRTWEATWANVVIERLFNATANRAEVFTAISENDLALATAYGLPDVLVAVSLYRANVALQRLDHDAAGKATDVAARHLSSSTTSRLQWWFHHTRAEIKGMRGNTDASFADYERALFIAREAYGLEIEAERTAANLLIGLRRAGLGQAVATMLVRYLHEKRTNALGPYFYQIVSDTLRWLGHFELAYQLRVHSMGVVAPRGGNLARDYRELARTLISLHRYDDARARLDDAHHWVQHSTIEEAIDYCNVTAEWCVAVDDLDGAVAALSEARSLSAVTAAWARALVAVAELLFTRQDFVGLAALINPLDVEAVGRDLQPRLLVLKAEMAVRDHDHEAAAELFDAAARLGNKRVARAETQAAVLTELGPWLSVATPGSVAHSMIEARRVYRSRWLRATAGDIRRSLAPAVLIVDADVTTNEVVEVFRTAIDELVLVAEFLFDAAGYVDTRPRFHESRMTSVVERIAARRGVELIVGAGMPPDWQEVEDGPVKRFVFGLVALITDHASAGTTIHVDFGDAEAMISTTMVDQDAVSAVLADLQQLLINSLNQERRMPHRASFLATFDAFTSLGWSVSFMNPAPGIIEITIDGPPLAVRQREANEDRERHRAVEEPLIPWPDGPLGAALREQYDGRFDRTGVNHDLLSQARASDDVDLHGCALLVNAAAAYDDSDLVTSDALVAELRELFAVDHGLESRVKPGAVYLYSLESLLATWSGDYRAKWIATARCVLKLAAIDDSSLTFAHMIYNWSNAELARGELASAWHTVGMCDATGASIQGRCLVLGLRTLVLLTEGRLKEATEVAFERVELARTTEIVQHQESLMYLAMVLGHQGRVDEAMSVIDRLSTSRVLNPQGQSDSLRALALFNAGRRQEAKVACLRAHEQAVAGYGSLILSASLPVHAEILLDEGKPEEAKRVLDTLSVEQHHYVDLAERLRVQRRVATALGDDEAWLEALRGQVELATRQARFDARGVRVYDDLRRCLDGCAVRDRQRIDDEQSAVASVVAHDLRNALGAAALALDLIEHYPADSARSRVAATLQPIKHLAEQLDSVTHWDGGRHLVEAEMVDLVELLETVTVPATALLESVGGQLDVDWQLPPDLTVRTHPTVLLAVLNNLVGNAVKHGRRGGNVKVGATYRAATQKNAYRAVVVVTIEDDGPGLPPIQVARLDPSSPQSTASGGLGLWIVRRYSGALGVNINVGTSSLGGARITVDIPIGEFGDPNEGFPNPTLTAGDGSRSAVSAATVTRPRSPAPSIRRVLVAEDDTRLSSLIAEVLVLADKEVVTAPTAADALKFLESGAVDLILADIELADGSTGFDVIAAAHSRGLTPTIVVMSGQSTEQIRALCDERIHSEFKVLQKPYSLSALIDVVG